jgi:hypothetical protein
MLLSRILERSRSNRKAISEAFLDGLRSRNQKAMEFKNNYKMYEVPDRITGTTEVEELRRLCPGRTWNFVGLSTLEWLVC